MEYFLNNINNINNVNFFKYLKHVFLKFKKNGKNIKTIYLPSCIYDYQIATVLLDKNIFDHSTNKQLIKQGIYGKIWRADVVVCCYLKKIVFSSKKFCKFSCKDIILNTEKYKHYQTMIEKFNCEKL
jgi:hypothetical protein